MHINACVYMPTEYRGHWDVFLNHLGDIQNPALCTYSTISIKASQYFHHHQDRTPPLHSSDTLETL